MLTKKGEVAMDYSAYPDFVKRLPEAKLPFAGPQAWLLQTEAGQIIFFESEMDFQIPPHDHGDQWGVVIDGSVELTIDGQTRTFSQGQTYFIPAGTIHSIRVQAPFRALDYFADDRRYETK
jgi:quercetin dioxygenase-like cupin family protein